MYKREGLQMKSFSFYLKCSYNTILQMILSFHFHLGKIWMIWINN